jgi:hypothetical protein
LCSRPAVKYRRRNLLMTSFFVCVLMPLSICRHGNSDFWRNDWFFPSLNPLPGNKTFGAIRRPKGSRIWHCLDRSPEAHWQGQ